MSESLERLVDYLYPSFKLSFNKMIYCLEDFKNFIETGSYLTKKEQMLIDWCNYLSYNTKFKKISVNYLEHITFESDNRKFKLEIDDNYTISLSYYYKKLIVDNGKFKDYSTPIDINGNTVKGDFYTLRNWFKKRNYLKRSK